MTAPFRDELASVQARAARLEEENQRLRARVAVLERRTGVVRARHVVAMVLPMVAAVVMGAGMVFSCASGDSRPRGDDETPREQRGVATAALGDARAPGAPGKPVPAYSDRYPDGACACQAGDPLCRCL